jgi:hypothetical protein
MYLLLLLNLLYNACKIREKKYFDEDNVKKATDLIITALHKKAHS